MEKSLKQFIENSQSVLILVSKNPYLDQIASGLALYLTIKDTGKKVHIACPSPMLVEFNRLVGVNKIVSEIGDKNLVIRFKNYDPQNIERVTYDIDEQTQEFKLSVIPKPNASSPTENQVDVKYSGMSADTVILIGGANEGHFPDISNDTIASAKLAHIGKQDVASSINNRTITSFAAHRASISELMASYIKEFTPQIPKDIASNLLAGLKEGTRDFSHTAVNADTFELAAELTRAGGDSSADYNQGNRGPKQDQQDHTEEKKEVQAVSQTDARPQQSQSAEIPADDESTDEAPASWLEPKIFKGANSK